MKAESNELSEGQIVIDGETEIDDLLLASKFAELENYKSASILTGIESSRGRKPLIEKSSEDVDIILTDEECDNSEDDGYESSENEDNEIKELIRKEMIYRHKTFENQECKYEILGEKLSDNYLAQFGISLDKNKETKNTLSDISECENEMAESDDEIIKKEHPSNINKDSHLENFEEKLNWLPNIEILDMPEKVDINLPCEFVGEIYSIINDGAIFGMEGIFIVKSDPSTIMLDLGSVLCLEDKTIIGTIIDTFGPITSAFYVLSKQSNVDNNLLKVGTKIYCDRRHSTILGKAGKIQCSYLSSTNTGNKKSQLFSTSTSKSPFSNKDFKKDPKINHPNSSNFNSKDETSVGSEIENGEVIPDDYDEEDEGQEESGDDISVGLNEVLIKKFVEKYDNLSHIQESAVEDSITNNSLPKKHKEFQKKLNNHNQGYHHKNKNNRKHSNQNNINFSGRSQCNKDRNFNRFKSFGSGNMYPKNSFSNFDSRFGNINHQNNTTKQNFGMEYRYNQNNNLFQNLQNNYSHFPYANTNSTFNIQEIQQNRELQFYNHHNSGSKLPVSFHSQSQTHQMYPNSSSNPHHYSQYYQNTDGVQLQHTQLSYQNRNTNQITTGFESNQYSVNNQYSHGNGSVGSQYMYNNTGCESGNRSVNYMDIGHPGSIPTWANFPCNNGNKYSTR
ncbi:homeobox-containing protein [Cryptosporidium ubiquitum]|uniref:Homeobox-containing protein n=1 Tax=Cryptosporidium ubiquitum TaxID=857276 RepID=A0A1J4MEF1_9CRYT|nr:homeobox-containing protein [Cryptosporidium ubiquitum]OII72593.1 homeobox-containing protein [Cryptosporidium ubiquitum]